MTENPNYEEIDAPEAGVLTPEQEAELLVDTSESNGESDFPDPPQDFDPDEISEEPDYEVEED